MRTNRLLSIIIPVLVIMSPVIFTKCQHKKEVARTDALDVKRAKAQRAADSTYFFNQGRRYEINQQLLFHPTPNEITPPPGYHLPVVPPGQ